MKRYQLTVEKRNHPDKKYISLGNNAIEAIERFCNREFFGNKRYWYYAIKMIDADTKGDIWATAKAGDGACECNTYIIASLIEV